MLIFSTLVAFGNVAEKKEFAAAMACAAIPAVYDILIVLILFPLEIIFDMMELLTGLMVAPFADCEDDCNSDGLAFDPIGAITEPIQKFILVKNKQGLGKPDYNGTFVNYCRSALGNDSKFTVQLQFELRFSLFIDQKFSKISFVGDVTN